MPHHQLLLIVLAVVVILIIISSNRKDNYQNKRLSYNNSHSPECIDCLTFEEDQEKCIPLCVD